MVELYETVASKFLEPPPGLESPHSRDSSIRSRPSAAGEDAARQYLQEGQWMPGTARRLALKSESGSRAVRSALESATEDVQLKIVEDCVGQVTTMIRGTPSSELLKSIVERYGEKTAGFITRELLESGMDVVGHRNAFRVLREVAKQGWKDEASQELIDIAIAQVRQHWRSRSASFFFQSVIAHGEHHQRQQIIDAIVAEAEEHWLEFSNAISNPKGEGDTLCVFLVAGVVASGSNNAEQLVARLVRDESLLQGLVRRKYGTVLIKALMKTEGLVGLDVRERLSAVFAGLSQEDRIRLQAKTNMPCLQCNAYGFSCFSCAQRSQQRSQANPASG